MVSKNIQIVGRVMMIMVLMFIWGNSLLKASESAQISSNVTEKIVEIAETVDKAVGTDLKSKITDFVIRKVAHFTQFAVLGIFTVLGFWKNKAMGLYIGVFSACTDEFIQIFVPGRGPQLRDVGIDSAGFIIGFLLCFTAVKLIYINKQNHFRKETGN